MNKFNELYNKIISEMKETVIKEDGLIEYYAAYTDDGKMINWDYDLMDLEMNCTMVKDHVDKFKIYKVNKLYHPPKYSLIETYVFNDETNNWGVTPNNDNEEDTK